MEPLIVPTATADDEWPEVMTFEPNLKEFANLTRLLQYIESRGAHHAGITKIRPPAEWVARARGYQPADIQLEIPAPVMQTIAPTEWKGAFQANHTKLPKIKVEEYRRLATNTSYVTPAHETYEELEDKYWDELNNDMSEPPIYGADVCESITDPEQKVWNISHLDSLLTEVMDEQIPGVNLPYLYFGMWRATFSWHVEDMDLYSVNFLHFGAPKTWYCIPPKYAYKLELAAEKLFPGMAKACPNLLRHKAVMMGPDVLQEFGVRVHKVVQEERDMIVVFPHAYHSGFNHGFNIAESTNFALQRWIEYGKRFRGCLCGDKDKAVVVDMAPFIQIHQPDQYDSWIKGNNFGLHPEDPAYLRAAYADAERLLSPEDLVRFQQHIKQQRAIPDWFLQTVSKQSLADGEDHSGSNGTNDDSRNVAPLDWAAVYPDKVNLFQSYDMSDFVEDWQLPKRRGPRFRAAKRKLLEDPDNCFVKIEPLVKVAVFSYLRKLRRQERYENTYKKTSTETNDQKVSQGFTGANVANMIAKKSRTSCSKNHRFRPCRKCTGCRTPNCSVCRFCLDMPCYGGPGINKQKCMRRVCSNPVMQSCDSCTWDAGALA